MPILIALLLVEVTVRQIPNNFSFKYQYVKEKGDGIRVLALGHSQLYNGFIPSLVDSSFNLSYGSQRYIDDYYLMEELIDYMPNLRYVIVPIGYMNVQIKDTDLPFPRNAVYYHEYMHINYGGQLPISQYLECFNPGLAVSKIWNYYVLNDPIRNCDSLGASIFKKRDVLSYRRLNLYTRTKSDKQGYEMEYEEYLSNLCILLKNKNIKMILVSPPVYWDGFPDINEDQLQFSRKYIHEFCEQNKVRYIDMEFDSTYNKLDFSNENHLCQSGAIKFTKKIKQIINNCSIN